MHWISATLLVCSYGFLKDIRPSDAYLSEYLVRYKHFTVEEIKSNIYPWWSYACVIGLIPVFLLTEFVHYKPMLLVQSIFAIATYALMIWANGLTAMKFMQIFSGLEFAAGTTYNVVLYSLIDPDHFQLVTSLTKCSSLVAKFLAGLVGQLFVSFDVLDLREIALVSFGSMCMSLMVAVMVQKNKPRVPNARSDLESDQPHGRMSCSDLQAKDQTTVFKTGNELDTSKQQCIILSYVNQNTFIDEDVLSGTDFSRIAPSKVVSSFTVKGGDNKYFVTSDVLNIKELDQKAETIHMEGVHDKGNGNLMYNLPTVLWKYIDAPMRLLLTSVMLVFKKMRSFYTCRTVMLWSVWSIIRVYGNARSGRYMQNLWEVISVETSGDDLNFNGAVVSTGVILAALCVAPMGCIQLNLTKKGRSEATMTIIIVLQAAAYIIMARTGNLWVAYALYVLLKVLVQVAWILQSAEIAKALPSHGYGFVLGCNAFCGFVIDSILTAIFVDDVGIGVDVRTQCLIYGLYFCFFAMVFFVITIVTILGPEAPSRVHTGSGGDHVTEASENGKQYIWSTRL